MKTKKMTSGKRRMSVKQKAALARGRAALKRRRTVAKNKPRKVSRKKGVSRSKRETMVFINQEGSTMKKSRRKSSRGRSSSGGKKLDIKNLLMGTVVGTGAAVAGTMITAKIPIANPKLKSALPLLMGIGLSFVAGKSKHGDMISQAATGMLIAGGLAMVKQFAPNLSLAGEDELYQTYLDSNAGQQLLGVNSDLMGVNSDLMGVNSDLMGDENDVDDIEDYAM
jgi:hypothetical protein